MLRRDFKEVKEKVLLPSQKGLLDKMLIVGCKLSTEYIFLLLDDDIIGHE